MDKRCTRLAVSNVAPRERSPQRERRATLRYPRLGTMEMRRVPGQPQQ